MLAAGLSIGSVRPPDEDERAQKTGCVSYYFPSVIKESMERRSASARPIVGSDVSAAIALVISLTVEPELASQCDTSSERLPA
jgi:hypothetical protein